MKLRPPRGEGTPWIFSKPHSNFLLFTSLQECTTDSEARGCKTAIVFRQLRIERQITAFHKQFVEFHVYLIGFKRSVDVQFTTLHVLKTRPFLDRIVMEPDRGDGICVSSGLLPVGGFNLSSPRA